MKKEWIVDVVERLPAALLSRGWGWLARRRHPRPAVALLKRTFVAATGIDMAEAREPMASYASLEDLFVRHLRAGARRIDPDTAALVSPVDGAVGACGIVEDGTLMQVKGRSYALARLLGDDQEARRYEGGPYATLYLSPKDYHRVHAPARGEVREAKLIPGRLLPVFAEAVNNVDELFARNERLVTYLDTPAAGRLAVVKVGATLVGRISVSYDASLTTNVKDGKARRRVYRKPHAFDKGADLGAFELGSTVVLVGEAGRVSFDAVVPGQSVRMGQRMGTIQARASHAPRGGRRKLRVVAGQRARRKKSP